MEKIKYKRKKKPSQTIIKTTLLLMSFFIAGACSKETSDNNRTTFNQTTEKPEISTFTILALGDSLTEGLNVSKNANYPAQLEETLHQLGYQQVKVINSGLSGETSSGLKNRLDWVLQTKPDLTILNIGANDAMRGLPLELTSGNIDEIITRIKASGSDLILAGMQIYDNLGREYVDGFKDIYPTMATKHELALIPFFLNHVAGDGQLNQADMIHPTAEGYAIIVKRNVLPVVQPIIATQISPTNNPE